MAIHFDDLAELCSIVTMLSIENVCVYMPSLIVARVFNINGE